MAMAVCARAVAATGPQEAARLNAEGVELAQKGDVRGAVDSFKAAIDADEHCVEASHNLGKLLIAGKQYEVAEKLLELTLRNNPDDAGSLVQLAQTSALLGKKSECEDAARRLAARDAKRLPSLALLLSGQLSHDCARAVAEIATDADPSDAEAWYDRGLVEQRAGRSADAETAYSRAVSLKADYVDAWVNLGNMQDEQGKTDDAVASYEKAYAAGPSSPLAQYNLGRMLLLKGRDPERGVELLQEATKHGDDAGASAARKLLLELLSKTKTEKGGAE